MLNKLCYDCYYFLLFSRAILQYMAAAYGKDDSLYPTDVRSRALVDQRIQFDLGTLYARMYDCYVSILLAYWASTMVLSQLYANCF